MTRPSDPKTAEKFNELLGLDVYKRQTHIKPVVNRTERVLASGPVRAIVEAEVIGWEYQGNDLNMINRYTIYGGHRDMKVDVLFDRPLKQEVFAAGVQILKEGGHMSDHKGLTICAGRSGRSGAVDAGGGRCRGGRALPRVASRASAAVGMNHVNRII